MAASFTLPTVLANLAAGNQPLSLIDGDLNALANPLLALQTFGNGYADAGAANALSITVSSPQTVAYAAYLTVTVIPAATNTGPATLAINALGAKNIFSYGANLVGGEILINVPAVFWYDGTQWNLANPQGGKGYASASVAVGSPVALTTATPANVTSITLVGAGDWDLGGALGFTGPVSTAVTVFLGGASSISSSIAGVGSIITQPFVPATSIFSSNPQYAIPTVRYVTTATTVVFLTARADFATSICSAFGALRARRA